MFDPSEPRLFALPPGADFPAELVAGLRQRMQGQPPEAMACVTLYLNTARMQRRVAQVFGGHGAGFLPRLRLVSDLAADMILPGLPPAVPALRRKLQLTVLISRLLDRLPDLAPRSALADLADSLSGLMAEMQGEGVEPFRLAELDVSDHSEHWARTKEFLTIIAPFFSREEEPDAESRQRRLAVMLAERWAMAPPAEPIIVAGSTGSRGATALFMQAVARLPQGALVLPGFDFEMPAQVWDGLDDALTSEDHPQYRFRRLMTLTGMQRKDITQWTPTPPPSAGRNALISLALRPAPVTDQWLIEGPQLPDLLESTADLSLIEAQSPRQEALSIALILRDAAESGTTAALVCPDRTLTRQVAAALDRWGIRPDDSAGIPLNQSAPGRFLRQVVRLFGQRLRSDMLLAILKHPLSASAIDRGQHLLLTRDLELTLRSRGPAFPTGPDLIAWAMAQREGSALGWATALAGALDDLESTAPLPLSDHVARTRKLAERLSRGPAPDGTGRLWEEAAGKAALEFFEALEGEAVHGGLLTPAGFRDLFDNLIADTQVRAPVIAHPSIMIWGTLEARVQGAELVILGGLNDGTWPSLPPPDPWLNRRMRQDAGLLLPERRIGLSAHDFQQAIAAQRVVLSRALRNAEAETVPSRWINRLVNLMEGLPETKGHEALAAMRARGQVWLTRAAAMDRAIADPDDGLIPARRPAPQPPIGARPRRLSLTRVETLIRDPYAIYADKVLRLQPLDPLRQVPDARDRGTVVHSILEAFVKDRPTAETWDDARQRLLRLTADMLDDKVPWPAARALWAARMGRAADHFLTIDSASQGENVLIEEKGELFLTGLDFTLYGTPDRIDRLPDGTLHLIDYKTGSPPTKEEQKSFAKQLLLAALLAEEGGFRTLGPEHVSKITYVGLGSGAKVEESEMTPEIMAEVRAGIVRLIGNYARRDLGYVSRRAVFSERFPGDYDHLARFGEWEMTDSPHPARVGGDGA